MVSLGSYEATLSLLPLSELCLRELCKGVNVYGWLLWPIYSKLSVFPSLKWSRGGD